MSYVNQLCHFLFLTEPGHFVLAYIFATFIGTMPAPTAESGTAYKWAFASLNAFAANLSRARGPRVESSPNFQAAVAIQTGVAPKQNGTP